MVDPRALVARFPALASLGLAPRPWQVPVVLQLSATDCGAACLAMILGFHGRGVRLEDVRTAMDVGRDGASALAILDAASMYALRGRAVRIEPASLPELPAGTILHWNLSHFVVFERCTSSGADGPVGIEIVDPAGGRRTAGPDEISRSLSGIAILFEKSEHFTGGKARGKPVWRYLRRTLGESPQLKRILAMSAVLQLFGLGLPLINGRLVDRVLPRNDMHLMAVLMAGLAMTLVFGFLTSMVRSHMLLNLRTQLDASLTLGFLDHMLRLPFAFFQRRQTGDLLMRLNSNAALREIMTSSVLSGVIDGALVLVYFVFLLAMSRWMALAAVVLVALQGAFYVLTRAKQLELASGSLTKKAASESYLIEVMEGVETLKASGLEHRAVDQWSRKYVEVLNLAIKRGEWCIWSDSILHTLRTAAPFLLLLLGTLQVMDGTMSLGTMLSAQAFATGFIGPITNLVSTLAQLQIGGSYIARIDEVFSSPVEQDRPDVQPAHRLTGAIALERVNFRYGKRGPKVLSDVSLRIRPGQLVAIVGRSGSGKSTLASLLLGLQAPVSGRVLYDDRDLAAIDVRGVRRQIGIVTQRPYIFGSTIRANIAFAAPEAPAHHVEEAARIACIDRDIATMPLGYDTPLTAGGASLSGGQRQRIALARSLLARPAVLVLDEATSALDALTERDVFANLEGWSCTRVVIAHRLSTVVRADLIVVMDEGRVVEQGSHEQLLAKCGHYAALVQAQLGSAPAPGERPEASGERPRAAAESKAQAKARTMKLKAKAKKRKNVGLKAVAKAPDVEERTTVLVRSADNGIANVQSIESARARLPLNEGRRLA